MLKRLVKCFLIAICIIVIFSATNISFASANGNTTEFAGGSGTEEDPYLISSATHLNNVRNHLDAHFKMTADIVFTDADFAEGGTFYNNGSGWIPIGDADAKFTGGFDGDGHTITGLYVNISATSDVYGGLFGHAVGTTIKNLGMIDSEISVTTSSGSAYAGGIAGYGGSIFNCSNTGSVSGTSYSGGIVGSVDHDNYTTPTITNCYNSGVVSGSGYVGGIVGHTYYARITSCYNTGYVNGKYNAGGIAGVAPNTIADCYNMGEISAAVVVDYASTVRVEAGGIVGSGSKVQNCYNTGNVSANGSGAVTGEFNIYAGGIVGYAYASATIGKCYNTGEISSSKVPSQVGGIVGFCARQTTTSVNNCYNTGTIDGYASAGIVADGYSTTVSNCYNIGKILGFNSHNIMKTAFSAGTVSNCYHTGSLTIEKMQLQSTFEGFDFNTVWQMGDRDSYPLPTLQDTAHKESAENTTEFAGGNGSPYTPYLIANKEHLDNVRNYPHANFKMTADIVFTNADFAQGGAFYNGGAGWTPIGDDAAKFTGTFNGNGHTITGLYVNISATSDVYGGLFGYIEETIINNLGMVDSEISVTTSSGGSYAGGIVGYASYNTTITNCYNMGGVSGNNYVGGISGAGGTISNCYNTGIIVGTSAGGIAGLGGAISNCYNTGNVSGNPRAGGIAGFAYSADISNCYNMGDISTVNSYLSHAGGILGFADSAIITNCHNMGSVNGDGSSGGGILSCANSSTITNCYNSGSISGSHNAGGISGYGSSMTISNCYNTGAVSGGIYNGAISGLECSSITNCYYLNNVDKGVGRGTDTATKCTEAELKYQGTFLGFNFTDVWTMGGNQNYPYPELLSVPFNRTGSLVSGTALSWNNTDDAVYVLYASTVTDEAIKAEWAAGSYTGLVCTGKETPKAVTVDGKSMYSQAFGFYEMANGNYKLAIFKPGKYVPKIIEITVNGSSVNLGQQKLWLYGDVTYDGQVNNLDALQINRNIAGLGSVITTGTPEEQAERFEVANVTAVVSGDTEINNLDALQINRYIAGLGSIFNSIK